MNEKLLQVIVDYTATVNKVMSLLKTKFGAINYISAKNTEQVPKIGFLDDEKKIRYNLHGIGITVDFEDISIVFDFDFHSNNHFGFNVWQLERYTRINSKKYRELSKLDYGELEAEFQNILNDLEKRGEIVFNQTKNRYYPS